MIVRESIFKCRNPCIGGELFFFAIIAQLDILIWLGGGKASEPGCIDIVTSNFAFFFAISAIAFVALTW